MRIALEYGRLVSADEFLGWKPRPARIVTDILGLLREDDEAYGLGYIAPRYVAAFHLSADPEAMANAITRFLSESGRLAATLLEASEHAQRGDLGHALVALVPYLPGLRQDTAGITRGMTRVDDPAALAAWSLMETLRHGPVTIARCENCRLPWLSDGDSPFCPRPAIGRFETCRSIASHQRFVDRHGDFNRERKKLYERKRRGTLGDSDYTDWLNNNRPGQKGESWVSFENWQGGKRPTTKKGRAG